MFMMQYSRYELIFKIKLTISTFLVSPVQYDPPEFMGLYVYLLLRYLAHEPLEVLMKSAERGHFVCIYNPLTSRMNPVQDGHRNMFK